MNKQALSIIFGSSALLCHLIGFVSGERLFNYCASFLARLAACYFAVACDRVRWYYYVPLSLTVINIFNQNTDLIFAEMFVQGLIYQITAYKLFYKKP